MADLNNPNNEIIPIRQARNNEQYQIYKSREAIEKNITTEENRLENEKPKEKINNKKEECLECKEYCTPDCCFCSESCCCNCSDSMIYPEINVFNALIFTIISFSIILFKLYCFIPQNHFDGHKIFYYIKNLNDDAMVGLFVIFIVEIIIYLPFVFGTLPCSYSSYPSWAREACCQALLSFLSTIITFTCCFFIFCTYLCMNGCDASKFKNCVSSSIRYIYKTAFYFYNIFYISTFILYYCRNQDIKIEQERAKWVFYVILSFLIIDIFSFIHVMIFGTKTNWKRNNIVSFLGFLVSLIIYMIIFEVKIYKYLVIPTVYYFLINNLFIYLMTQKWTEKLYPLYSSVGYLFVFLAIPIILFFLFRALLQRCENSCSCNSIEEKKKKDSNSN